MTSLRPSSTSGGFILDRFTLTDHVAIVTGAGRGLGAATAVALAQAGADVVISARSADQLESVAEQVRKAGRRAVAVPADLSDTSAAAGWWRPPSTSWVASTRSSTTSVVRCRGSSCAPTCRRWRTPSTST